MDDSFSDDLFLEEEDDEVDEDLQLECLWGVLSEEDE